MVFSFEDRSVCIIMVSDFIQRVNHEVANGNISARYGALGFHFDLISLEMDTALADVQAGNMRSAQVCYSNALATLREINIELATGDLPHHYRPLYELFSEHVHQGIAGLTAVPRGLGVAS